MGAMTAAVLGDGGFTMESIEVEDPRPGEVLVRVSHCGVCHSDVSVVDGSLPGPRPVVLGHEAAGVVEAVGPGVVDVAPGDKAVLTPLPSCGQCFYCVRGNEPLCERYSAALFTSARPDGTSPLSRDGAIVHRGLGVGGWAELAVVPAEAVVKVPDEVELADACVLGCAVQTGVGAVLNTAGVEEGATVLVQGGGGIGVSVLQGARLAGAATVVLADPVAERREAAVGFGATDVIDPSADDVTEVCRQLTAGRGVDYVFEAAGRAALVTSGLEAVRPGGTVVCVGAPPLEENIAISPAVLFAVSEKRLLGCLLGSGNARRDVPRYLSLAARGRLDLAGMVTHRYGLADAAAGVDNLVDRRGIRTVLRIT